ncbi:MAG TPA: alpha/beta-hydrolase family protein [Trebonia sp.]|nr:alpha/beta-hydrolase family protein [Trebonia sp.]
MGAPVTRDPVVRDQAERGPAAGGLLDGGPVARHRTAATTQSTAGPGTAGAAEPPGSPERPAPGERPAKPPWWYFTGTRRYLAGFRLAGLTGALAFYCLSLTPSLLPRAWYLQAVMSAITAAIGYGAGLLVGWLLRSLIPWRPPPVAGRIARWALAVAAVVLIPLFGVLGAEWQHQIRELNGVTQDSEASYILVVLVTVVLTAALIMLFRGLRWVVRAIGRLVGRFIPHRAAAAAVVLVVCVLLGLVVTGVLSRGAISAASSVFGGVDGGTADGISQPSSALRSGSPQSLVPWQTLGRQGRTFVGSGPTAAQIGRFTGAAADEPIRVYAGLKSAPTIAAESALVVRELDRTGAFSRKVLVVATTTGTGWVNPAMIDPLEYMYGGDTGVAAIQYSYLPSWISFIADKEPAQEAGRDLFDAIYDRWSQLPARHRPKLVVFGESLGSFGGESAFSGADDIRARTSGVLWVGPTNSNTLWSRFTADRDPGTPQWQPVYEGGQTVRFITAASQLSPPEPGWSDPRVVYLQNTSDPIVWWSWELAFHQPDWLRGTHPPGVSSAMHWYPLVTFWQVAADLALATAVPPGHGHTYGMLQGASAWAAIIAPPGWTARQTTALGNLPAD